MKKSVAIIFSAITAILIVGLAIFGGKNGATGKTVEIRIGRAAFRAEIADTLYKRTKGLSGREALDKNRGMFFVFDSPGIYGFWMRNMKFPIDIIWIKSGEVIGFVERAEPASQNASVYYPPEAVDNVLEVFAGAVGEFNIKIGDKVE